MSMQQITLSLLLFLMLLGLPLYGCQDPNGLPAETARTKPLIAINQQSISLDEFIKAFNQTRHPDQQLSEIERQELQRAFLIQLIDRTLIHQEAELRGVLVGADELGEAIAFYRQDYPEDSFDAMLKERGLTLAAWQHELEESLTMEKLLEEVVYRDLEVSDREISAYYKANREAFNRPEQVRVRQILVADEAEGHRLLGLLRKGENFANVARQHSLSPDAEQGGDLGFFSRGEMPAAFDAVVFDLPVGRLSELVQSEYGSHLFLVEEKRKPAQLGKAEASAEIRGLLERQKRETIYLDWLQELRSRATIEVDWLQLENQSKN
ncbi:MAG: peptidylprolyl isomerase [Desulfuromonas sp.]|nr:MAG: peptidylprolyl isomerase [Desulfuromonas sp.]